MGLSEKLRLPIVRDVLGIGFVKVFAIPASLGVAIMLARNLGPNDYGTYAFVLSLTNLVALTLTGGLMQLMTREVAFALQEDARGLLNGMIRSATVWGLSSSLLVIFCTWIVFRVLFPDIVQSLHVALLLSFMALPILTFSPVWAGTLRGYGFSARSQYPSLLLAPITQLATVTLLLGFGLLSVQTAILAFIVANTIAAAVGLYLMQKTVSGSLRGAAVEYQIASWAKSSVVFTSIALINFMNTQIGVLILGFISTAADVAAFQIADRGAQLVILTTAIIELVLAPHVARAYKAQSSERLQSMFSMSRRVGGIVTLVVALPLIFAGKPIVQFAFGADYVELAVQPLAIISAALAIRSMLGSISTFLSMTGNERLTLAAQGFGLLVNVVLMLVLADSLGAVGAAWASAAGIICWSGLLALLTHRKLGIRILRL